MESNSITTAPQIMDTDAIYKLWRRTHAGNSDSFYKFMTTPSPERDSFVNNLGMGVKKYGNVLSVFIS